LGVKTITIVDETLKLINKRHKIKMKLDTIPLDNKKTYETLSEGENLGTFQLNKKFIKPILRQTKPDNIEDLIFLVSADRPGPMASNAFEHYYKRKHGEEKIETHHPSLKKVYKDSFGVLVYSEHLMRTATVFAGMNAIDSEKMRKIVKSKNPADFLAFKEKFISGAIKKWTK
ncbi:MAG: DNA polymerase III subunit alpha, partial [archaeon]